MNKNLHIGKKRYICNVISATYSALEAQRYLEEQKLWSRVGGMSYETLKLTIGLPHRIYRVVISTKETT